MLFYEFATYNPPSPNNNKTQFEVAPRGTGQDGIKAGLKETVDSCPHKSQRIGVQIRDFTSSMGVAVW